MTKTAEAKVEDLATKYVLMGCFIALTGRAKVPEGYAILLNADRSHYFWIRHDGAEGPIHWDKWAVLRMAKANAEKSGLGDGDER
jgi:hypothetical protein